MAKLGREIENRINVSKKVIAAATTHGPGLAPLLAAKAAEAQGAAGAPAAAAFAAMFASLAATLKFATGALESAALAYSAEHADDVAPREARGKAADVLLGLVVQLRATVESTLGASVLATYGLEGDTPRNPKALASHVTNVLELLGQSPVSVTTDLGSTFSTAATITGLTAKKAPLDAALGDVDREARELEDALGKRDQAIDHWSDAYQGVANALTGLFRLAGRKDLAERVRPTSRTVSGEDAGPPEPTGEVQGSPPAGG
jgi:hypothetical protein